MIQHNITAPRRRPAWSAVLAAIVLALAGPALAADGDAFRRASDLYAAGRFDQALPLAEQARKAEPDRPEVAGLLGWVQFRRGKLAEARAVFESVLARDDFAVAGMQGLAWVAHAEGRLDDAREHFNDEARWARHWMGQDAWESFPEANRRYVESIYSDASHGLGLVAAAKGERKEARRRLRDALRVPNQFSGHAPVRKALVDLLYASRDYDGVADVYRKPAAAGDPVARERLAWALYLGGHGVEAAREFEAGLNVQGDHRGALFALAAVELSLGRPGKARARVDALVRADAAFPGTTGLWASIAARPESLALRKMAAASLLHHGYFGPARLQARAALAADPQDCGAALVEAWAEMYLGRGQLGLSAFDAAGRRGCEAAAVALGRAVTLFYLGYLDDAQAVFEEAARLDPKNLRARVGAGAVAFARRDYPAAIAAYSRYLDRLPGKEPYFSWAGHALNNLGWSYYYTGQFERAVDVFNRLGRLHRPGIYPQAFVGLGWSYLKLERRDAARKAFDRALRIAPANASARQGRAQLG